MRILEKITELKNQTNSQEAISVCEDAISALSTVIYNEVSPDAKEEIENVAINTLFEGLSEIEDQGVQNWLDNEKRIHSVSNLGIREGIVSLREEADENSSLKILLSDFKDRLDRNIHEALLYEEFISALQYFYQFPKVGNAVDAIKDRVDKYKNDVDITKIIETMKETRSNYLIPLIEDVVENYLNNKTEQTKSHLKETLMKFSYDPFVRDLISIVSLDAKDLQLEYANAECDVERIFSPLIYLGENEAVFNVKGTYYIKKGNIINKFPKEDIDKLDEDFVTLCNIINLNEVEIDSKGIHVFHKEDYALIRENEVYVNEQKFSDSDFARSAEVAKLAGNQEFFYIVEAIRKNYTEIAEVDFVKRVYLKEDQNYSADVFKLRDNLFITTHDPNNAKTTFYRNVNPIQAKNIMLEHLSFDVSNTFEDILPQEEKINTEINETKTAFTDYINMLETKIHTLSNQTANEVTNQVLEALKEELHEVKNDYKDYLNRVEIYMRAPEDVDVSELDEGITISIDVNGKKYTVPIPTEGDGEGSEGGEEDEASGTMPGSENIENTAASEITFDDGESELLTDQPTIEDDEIDLGAEEIEQDAEDAEAEAEEDEEEADAEADDFSDEEDSDLDLDDEGDEDEDIEDQEKKKKKKKKKKKTEESTDAINDSTEEPNESSEGKHKKVFLLKKKKK